MNSIVSWFQQLDFQPLLEMLIIVVSSVLCITIHETCHGIAAYCLGDRTAKDMGRLTLNPLHHIDLMGLVMMALVHFGWAKPVPVDMRNFKNPKTGMAITALAGPVSNVLLAFVAMLLRSLVLAGYYATGGNAVLFYIVMFLEYTAILSAGLAVFNLFPVPPLDGSKVVFALLPDRAYLKLMRYERYGMIIMAVLLLLGVLDAPLMYLRGGLLNLIQCVTDPVFMFFASRI